MPFVQKRLINPTTLTTSASSALYTVPAGFSTVIKQLVVTNTTGSAATFTFYIGDAVAGNALFSATSVAANDTVIINLSQVLQSNEVLRALASANSTLNLTVSGVENDGPLEPSANFIANDSVTVNKIADGSVTSAKIADGTIVDTDINTSAAIAQSKVANLTSDLALKAPTASPTFTGVPLAPTAAAGTNTTQLATTAFANTAGGLVLLTSSSIPGASTSFSFTNFTSTYTNYQVKVRIDYVSNDCDLYLRYNTGAGPDAGANYFSATLGLNDGGGGANSNQGGATFQTVGPLDSAQSNGHRSVTMEIFSPLEATRTEMTYSSWGYTQTGTGTFLSGGGCYNIFTAHTGFTMFTSNGTSIIGGTYQVYGYRK